MTPLFDLQHSTQIQCTFNIYSIHLQIFYFSNQVWIGIKFSIQRMHLLIWATDLQIFEWPNSYLLCIISTVSISLQLLHIAFSLFLYFIFLFDSTLVFNLLSGLFYYPCWLYMYLRKSCPFIYSFFYDLINIIDFI